jgi:hypothetical protein
MLRASLGRPRCVKRRENRDLAFVLNWTQEVQQQLLTRI